jgi:hypothetical protein
MSSEENLVSTDSSENFDKDSGLPQVIRCARITEAVCLPRGVAERQIDIRDVNLASLLGLDDIVSEQICSIHKCWRMLPRNRTLSMSMSLDRVVIPDARNQKIKSGSQTDRINRIMRAVRIAKLQKLY